MPEKDDKNFIDESLRHLELDSDAMLEALANLPKNTLSKARQGAQPLSGFAKAKIYDLRGYKWAADALAELFGEKGQAWLASEDRKRRRRALKKLKEMDAE